MRTRCEISKRRSYSRRERNMDVAVGDAASTFSRLTFAIFDHKNSSWHKYPHNRVAHGSHKFEMAQDIEDYSIQRRYSRLIDTIVWKSRIPYMQFYMRGD